MRNFYLVLVANIGLLLFSTAQAAPSDLPETGQTTCTDTTGAVISCVNSGQDGELKAGVAWPDPRFTVNGTGDCMTDNLTNLVWVRSPDVIPRTFQEAIDFTSSLVICGSANWRLPNINELESLVNIEITNQAGFLNNQGFSDIQAQNYWSSSIYGGFGVPQLSSWAWVIVMADGSMSVIDRSFAHFFVLPVRSGK